MTARLVSHATRSPSKCFVSGAGHADGPFIDTGKKVRGYGRVYISIRHISNLLREAGWRPAEEVEEQLAEAQQALGQAREFMEKVERYDELMKLLGDFVPRPEPVVRREVEIRHREPTEAEIAAYVQAHPEVLKKHERPAPGSTEEWLAHYGPKPEPRRRVVEVEPTPEPEAELEEPPATVVLHDQEVSIDAVLDNRVQDIVAWAEGVPPEVAAAFVARERWRAVRDDRSPRVMVLRAFGEDV